MFEKKKRILECVAVFFPRGYSWRRNWTRVSCISGTAGRFLIPEPPGKSLIFQKDVRQVTQSRPTLCDPMDCSPPGSSAMPSSRGASQSRERTHISCLPRWQASQRYAAAAATSLQSCLTLCDPIDGSLPGSAIPGILQARTLEWVAISFSNAWKWKVKVKLLSHVQLLATPWTAAYQAPLSMGFPRQEYWSGPQK